MLISLIVPFYNLAPYVGDALGGIAAARRALGDDRDDVEVVCVDDGSTDGTGAALDEYGRGAPWLRVVHKPNGGEGSARNAGIAATSGEYLMFADGDDVLLSNALTVAVRLARAHSKADIIGMRYAVFADGDSIPEPADGTAVKDLDTRQCVPAELLCRLGVFPTLFRRLTFAGLRFSALSLGADREYVMAALARAELVVASDAVVEGYRIRNGSMAHAKWTVRKVGSLNDHAANGLAALAASGKRIDAAGAGYVASLVVSEVPARLARLGKADGVEGLWRHWIESVRALPVGMLPPRVRVMRRLVLSFAASPAVSIGMARVCRALGVA